MGGTYNENGIVVLVAAVLLLCLAGTLLTFFPAEIGMAVLLIGLLVFGLFFWIRLTSDPTAQN